jgi:hypothetical protein
MIKISKDTEEYEWSVWNGSKIGGKMGCILTKEKPALPTTILGWYIEEYTPDPPALTLEQIKQNKNSELLMVFEGTKTDTVTAESFTWFKNRDKTQLQHEAIQLAELKSDTTVNLIDSTNTVRNLTIAQAKNVIIAAADGYATNYWNYQTKLAQVAAASTEAEVSAITW